MKESCIPKELYKTENMSLPYSRVAVTKLGNLTRIQFSGIIAPTESGVGAQMTAVLGSLVQLLATINLTLDDVTKIRIFVATIETGSAETLANAAYVDFMDGRVERMPTRVLLTDLRPPKKGLVEIEPDDIWMIQKK